MRKTIDKEGEGEGAKENELEVSSLVSSMDGESINRGRGNSLWNRFKSKTNCFYS
jgi:hypothetical protein